MIDGAATRGWRGVRGGAADYTPDDRPASPSHHHRPNRRKRLREGRGLRASTCRLNDQVGRYSAVWFTGRPRAPFPAPYTTIGAHPAPHPLTPGGRGERGTASLEVGTHCKTMALWPFGPVRHSVFSDRRLCLRVTDHRPPKSNIPNTKLPTKVIQIIFKSFPCKDYHIE